MVLASILGAGPAGAERRVEKMAVPEVRSLAGQTLRLQGTAVGKATFLGVKVYVAALYTSAPLRTPESLRAASAPLRFDFTFLRRVDPKTNARAWDYYFREVAEPAYPGWPRDVAVFRAGLGRLERGTVQTVEMEGDQTRFFEGGVLKCVIPGKDFQRAFLSIWASGKREQRQIRRGLLGIS